MSNAVNVKITSFVNPHEFYFILIDKKSEQVFNTKRKVADVERKISRIYTNRSKQHDIQIGEIYGCFHSAWGKWVRGRVIERSTKNDFKVFLLDHGFFKFFRELIEIPQELKVLFDGNIKRGSLLVESVNLNSYTNSSKWTDETHLISKQLDALKNKASFMFIQIYTEKETHVGELFVVDGNEKYSVTERFFANGCVRKYTKSHEIFKTLLEKKFVDIHENCKRPKKRMEFFEKPKQNLPKSLIIHGHQIEEPWKNPNDYEFFKSLKKIINIEFQSMTRVQSFIWPQIFSKQNVIIIDGNQDDFTRFYLVPLIGKITYDLDCSEKMKSMGPTTIIFATCTSKIEELFTLIKEYTSNLKVVKTFGICEIKKYDLISGCDLLITTPPAFLRLISDISVKIIDENRLRYVIYDDFYQLSLKFDQYLNKTLNMFLNLPLKPQFIVTSNSLSNSLKCKLINQLPQIETILCVNDNYIDLASYTGMKLLIEFVSKRNDVYEALLKDVKDSKETTVVVSSNDLICKQIEDVFTAKGIKCMKYINDIKKTKYTNSDSNDQYILIVSDSMIESETFCYKSAQYLIHFDLPSNWKQFSRRFQVLKKSILNKLTTKSNSIETKIYLHDDNMEQLIAFKEFASSHNLSNSFKDVLERAKLNWENIKRQQNVSLCNVLLLNGKCEKDSCSSRHILSDQDKPMNHLPSMRSLIKFDLISVQNPTSFTVKITEYFDNNKWISRDETNKIIQQRLNELQIFCKRKESLLMANEAVVGGVYAKFDKKMGIWVRVKIIERVSKQILKVYFLDFGTTALSIETKLLKLPGEFDEIYPLVCKLQIVDLRPLDKEYSYEESHTQKLKEMLNKVHKSAFFVCKIDAVICDTIFTKSFESKSSVPNSFKFDLKRAHQMLKISEVNESVSQNIKRLMSTLVVDDMKSKVDNQNSLKKKQSSIAVKEKITIKNTNVVSWKKLKYGKNYHIRVAHYKSPSSFFIIQENGENLTLKKNLEILEKGVVVNHLSQFEPGTFCFYKTNKIYRSIIISQLDNELEILLVDYGEVKKSEKDYLYEISSEYFSLHFQTIHCSMMGIRPKYNMKFWPKMQCNAIERLIRENYLKMLVINNDEKSSFKNYGMNCYKVILFYTNTNERLDQIAINKGFADVDLNSKNLEIEVETEDVLDLEEFELREQNENHSVHVGKDLEKILDLKRFEKLNISDTTSSDIIIDSSSIQVDNLKSSSLSLKQKQMTSNLLENLYKPPQIEWRQDEVMIYVIIDARDSEEYSLSITETSFEIIIKYSQAKFEKSLVLLFGLLCVDLCSHEKNGSNIIVRLTKKNSFIWPRLTSDSKKSHYIKFSNEKVPELHYESDFDSSSEASYRSSMFLPDTGGRPAGASDFEGTESDKEFNDLSSGEEI